jgi:signal transduction histidine kinase
MFLNKILRSLKGRFILTLVVISGALIAGLTVTSITVQKDLITTQETQKLALFINLLEASIRNRMLENHGEDVGGLLENIHKEYPEASIALYNSRGILRFYSGEPIEPLKQNGLIPENLQIDSPGHSKKKINGTVYWVYYTSVKPSRVCFNCHEVINNAVGFTAIALKFNAFKFTLKKFVVNTIIFSGLIFVVIITGLWAILTKQIDRPLAEMIKFLKNVESGNLKARIKQNWQTDEFRQLSISLNNMTQELERNLEKIQELYYQQLQRADRLASVGELASSIAHEIKNPLAGISGAIQILSKEFSKGEREKEIFDEILKQINRVNKTIGDLLSFSKPSPLVIGVSNINKVIKDTLILVEQQAKQNNVLTELNLDPDIPNTEFDEKKIQQALLNLMLNAVQAMPDGGKMSVLSKAYFLNTRDYLLIQVKDTGPGIPQEYLSKIFDPFFTTKPNGTGLGLAIVKRIINEHAGKISVESAPAKGTTFTIELPVAPVGLNDKNIETTMNRENAN